MHRRALSAIAALVLLACGQSNEAPAPQADTGPILGAFELAISRSHQGSQPVNAARVEVTTDALRLDGRQVLALERGRVPAAELGEQGIGALRQAIQGAPARSSAALWVHLNAPYLTLTQVLQTLESAGLREVHVAVRRGPGPELGWMRLARWRVVPAGDEPVTFSGQAVPWSTFASNWGAVYEACRAGRFIDCDPVAVHPAEGGELQVELFARDQAMKFTFSQVNAPETPPPAATKRGPALIEGVRAPAPRQQEEVVTVSEGAFNFRFEESVAAESAMSRAASPVCGAQSCQAIVVADATTPSMRIISMIGAFAPNGVAEPELAFRTPTERR